MNEIKSEAAECLLNAAKQSNINGCPVSLSAAMQEVILAETELAEAHAKELQEMKGQFDCDKYHAECNHEIELQELKNKAVEQHKQHCTNSHCQSFSNWRSQICSGNCEYMKSFLTGLNK